MNGNPTISSFELEHHTHTNVLYIDNLISAADRLPHGDPFTYGATPLDRMTTLSQQIDVANTLQEFMSYGLPDEIPGSVKEYVRRTFVKRFHGRAAANEENYTTALKSKDELAKDQRLTAIITRAELGQASPTELLITRSLLGIRSVELACLTHPYGEPERMRILPVMRDAVKQHIELFGGAYQQNPETRYRVKEIIALENDKTNFRDGLLMTRKRTLATLSDGTVIRERSSFVLRTDEDSMLTEADIAALMAVDLKDPLYQDELVKAARLDEIAEILLDTDTFTQAIPISSTIYAYNPTTTAMIQERDEKLSQERRIEFARLWPNLAEAAQKGITLPGPSPYFEQEMDGMFYVGPELHD